jgi:hypothetical protein
MCTVCGAKCHLNVSDVEHWYSTRHPGLSVGSIVPDKCPDCSRDISPGDDVVIRNQTSSEHAPADGTSGTVEAALSSADSGSIYIVRLATGEERPFTRRELRRR